MSSDGDFYRGDPPPQGAGTPPAPGYGQPPGYGPPPGPPAYGPPGYGPPGYGPPAYGPSGYGPSGYGSPAYGPPGYGPPGYPSPFAYRRPTNTMAVLALVFIFVFTPVSLVLGLVARRQIRETGEEGDGMALAGIIVGGISVALFSVFVLFYVVAASSVSFGP